MNKDGKMKKRNMFYQFYPVSNKRRGREYTAPLF